MSRSPRLLPPLLCGVALALQMPPTAAPSQRMLAALMGMLGSLWLASSTTRGRSPALFATFAFLSVAVLIGLIESLPSSAPFASLFGAGGLAWYAARASGSRIARILATLGSVLGTAWVVGASEPDADAMLTWAWIGAHANAIGALAVGTLDQQMRRPSPPSERP